MRPLSSLLTLYCLLLTTAVSFARETAARPAVRGHSSAERQKPVQTEHHSPAQEQLTHSRSFDALTLERLVFDCVNRERQRHGLRHFVQDTALWQAARAHSGDMASRGFFSHDTPRGLLRKGGFGDRLRQNGVVAPRMAENIAMLPLVRSRTVAHRTDERGRRTTDLREARLSYSALAAWAVQQWMESPGHRKNILSPNLTTMGIGAVVGLREREEYVYLTQDFGGN